MTENRKLKVFLCHSKDDKPKVRELYHRLMADGFDPWLDEERLMPGQDWDLEIRKAVRESNVVIVCLSNNSITKAGYVQKEIRFALDVAEEQPEGTLFIIPARLEDCRVPFRLSKWQWVDLFETRGYERILLALTTQNINKLLFTEPEIIRIPAGKFLMGTKNEQALQVIKEGKKEWKQWVAWELPQHVVELSEYFIGKFPVTNKEYQSFIRDRKYTPPRGWLDDQFPAEKGNHPVVNIAWEDTVAYCSWLSSKTGKLYRLPTEAEWEKAARGENGYIYPWGNEFDSKKANTRESNIGDTTEIGRFSPRGDSPYGCVDIAGNVWEWCNDWFEENEYKQRQGSIMKNPVGPLKGDVRILRGGSFDNLCRHVRCAARNWTYPNGSYNDFGFRIVLSQSNN